MTDAFQRRLLLVLSGVLSTCTSLCLVLALLTSDRPWTGPRSLLCWHTVGLLCLVEAAKFLAITYFHMLTWSREEDALPLPFFSRHSGGNKHRLPDLDYVGLKAMFFQMCSSGIMFLASCLAFYVLAVLFGAPFFAQDESTENGTFVFAALLSTLTTLPLSYMLGSAWYAPFVLFGLRPKGEVGQMLERVTWTTLFGAWMGSGAIPLDWDRPWQEWPAPCCMGAILAHMIINLLHSFYYAPQLLASAMQRSYMQSSSSLRGRNTHHRFRKHQ